MDRLERRAYRGQGLYIKDPAPLSAVDEGAHVDGQTERRRATLIEERAGLIKALELEP
jgi:hypothetical protein